MADNKLEQMLEKLVNNDRSGADELFHEFVIEKSRGIYEKMLETDLEDLEVDEAKDEEVDESSDDEETNEASDEEVDESSDDEETNEATDEEVDESDEDLDETTDEEVDENFGEFTPEADPMGGDAGDAMMKDIEADGDEGEDGDMDGDDEEEIEDRVVDLEDALDDLKSEFEKMMAGDNDGEEGDEDAADMPDMDPEGDEDKDEAYDVGSELSVEDEAPAFEGTKTAGEQMREYVEKVTPPKGDTGTDGTKSPVAGKNDMGGTAGNIAGGSAEEKGGKASAPKEDNAGNVNVPGAKASKSMTPNAKGHGTEKKGAGETGTDSKSPIGS